MQTPIFQLAGDATLHVELLSLKESLSQYEDEDEIQVSYVILS